jgi:acetylornithine deacetylase
VLSRRETVVTLAPVKSTVELLERLVAIDSVNPTLVPGGAGEIELARFVAGWFEERGIEVELEELGSGRANVVGRVRGSGGGRTLMLNAHLDTVGLGGPDGGLVPRVDGTRMYGRGTYDMKGSLAAIMLAAARAVERNTLAGDLVVTAVADEEAESMGSERIAKTVAADAAIVAEPTDMRVAIAHRGFVWLELETQGRAAHGSRYDLGIDANALMGPALAGIGELDRRLAEDGRAHPLLGRGSLHTALVEGGTEASTYAARCVAKVERRTLPGETVASVEAEMREIAGAATVTALFSREPLETPRDAPIVDVLRSAAGEVLGEPPEIVGVPFWTDAALFSAAGIPTVVFGPSGEGAHEQTEWVDLDDVERVAEILLRTATEFCS